MVLVRHRSMLEVGQCPLFLVLGVLTHPCADQLCAYRLYAVVFHTCCLFFESGAQSRFQKINNRSRTIPMGNREVNYPSLLTLSEGLSVALKSCGKCFTSELIASFSQLLL